MVDPPCELPQGYSAKQKAARGRLLLQGVVGAIGLERTSAPMSERARNLDCEGCRLGRAVLNHFVATLADGIDLMPSGVHVRTELGVRVQQRHGAGGDRTAFEDVTLPV